MPADNLSTATQPFDSTAVSFRTASLRDARTIWKLVRDSRVLDANSLYCYLLLCRDFADTCVVACCDSAVVGFVTAYRPPRCPETIFIWQIGVAQAARRQGLAKRLLHTAVSLPGCDGVRFLEATVTPANTASRRLFQSFAKDLNAECRIERGFTAEMFCGGNHEEEQRFCIGPFADSIKDNTCDRSH